MTYFKYIFCVFYVVLITTKLCAFTKDTIKIEKQPKHYFKTIVNLDYYATGNRALMQKNYYSNKLKSYQVNQFAFGVTTPIFTKNIYKKDSTQISNFHLLVGFNYVGLTPKFNGITTHHLSKTSIGLKAIYNNGKKSVFYAEVSPFTTRDNGFRYTRSKRLFTTLLYNCTVNKYFSFRVGYTRTYIFANKKHLPYIGFRVGKLNGVNLSVQFPRNVSINVPIGSSFKASVFVKPQGGLYTMANTDTLYYLNADKKINFGRYEFLSGLRADVLPTNNFNFYVSAGLTTQNFIGFYSESFNKNNNRNYKSFYKEKIQNSVFINIGLVFKIGKSKSMYNNYNLYDAHDIINKDVDNINKGNNQIPTLRNKIKNITDNDVQDLIETTDLY